MAQSSTTEESAPGEFSAAAARPWSRRATVVVLRWLALAAVADVVIWYLGQAEYLREFLSPANVFVAIFCTTASTVILLTAWFVCFGPAPGPVRRRVAAAAVGLVAIFFATFRMDMSGNLVPERLAFRWSPKPDRALATLALERPPADTVDLAETSATDYPEFLGRGRHATVEGIKLATDWKAEPPRKVWGPQPIGAGWSGFSVVSHFAVTQEQRGDDELISCYDVLTGELEWSHVDRLRFDSKLGGDGPRATPTIDEGRVYALGATGLLTCLEGATGQKIWQRNIVLENKGEVPQWGKSCSPLILNQLVIASAGGPDGKSLVAYDKLTGGPVWAGGDDKSAYASPVLMTLAGVPQIVIVNATSIAAHDPADGHELWSQPWPGGSPSVSQPVAIDDNRLFVSKGYGVGCQLWQVERGTGDWSVDVVWKNLNLKTKFTNVVLRDGFVFGLDEGILTCVDLKDGSRRWKQGRYGHGQVLLVEDVILVQAESGEVALVAANPERFEQLTSFAPLDGKTWNNPTLTGRYLLVRNAEQAACYELPAADVK